MHHLLSKFALILKKFLTLLSFHLFKICLDFIVEHNLKNLKTNNKIVHTLVTDNDRSLCLLSSHDGMKYYIKKLLLNPTWLNL
jgi:hypothetical protein